MVLVDDGFSKVAIILHTKKFIFWIIEGNLK